jgi:hypothetical protein
MGNVYKALNLIIISLSDMTPCHRTRELIR